MNKQRGSLDVYSVECCKEYFAKMRELWIESEDSGWNGWYERPGYKDNGNWIAASWILY